MAGIAVPLGAAWKCRIAYCHGGGWPRSFTPDLHLATSEMRCWSGRREILTELSLCYSIVYYHNGARRYEQFLQVVDCIGLWTCLVYLYFPSASVSLIFMLHWCYILEYFDSEKNIRFSTSLPYRLLSLSNANSTPSSWVTLTTSQRRRLWSQNNSGRIEWPIFEQNESIRIANRNALLYINLDKFICYIIYLLMSWTWRLARLAVDPVD